MPVKENSKLKSGNDSSSGSSESEDSNSISLPTPPDGGWGWVVVAASFMVHLIADGCAFSFGVLYVELLHYFKESKGKTAWVGSLFVSVPLLTGPIASALTNKYGCRTVTVVGSIIAGGGLVVSSFATSIEQLCFTFGIIAGFGLSMVYVPAVVIVAYYFEKKRAFATGIAVAGSGIGTFVFAPLTEWLIEIYTWKGAVLILGGIMLNMIVCGSVFRPLFPSESLRKKAASKQLSLESRLSRKSSSSGLEDQCKFTNGVARDSHSLLVRDARVKAMFDEPIVHSLVQFPTYLQKDLSLVSPDLLRELERGGKTFEDLMKEPDFLDKYYATKSLTDMSQLSLNAKKSITGEQDHPQLPNGTANSNDGCSKTTDPTRPASHSNTLQRPGPSSFTSNEPCRVPRCELIWQRQGRQQQYLVGINRSRCTGQAWQMQRKDIFYRGSLVRPGLLQSQKRAVSCPDIVMHSHLSSNSDITGRFGLLQFSREVKHVLKEMMDMAILRSIVFVYFCISSMLLYMWYDVPYLYTPDKAIEMGKANETGEAMEMGMLEGKASFLVAIIGITSTVGQVVVGFIGDRPGVNALLFYNALTSIAGIGTMLVPIITGYAGLAIYSGSYGFFISGNYALTTIILVELLGMEKLTNAYGLVMLAEGLANLVGPPLAGNVCTRFGDSLDDSPHNCLILECEGSQIYELSFYDQLPCSFPFQNMILVFLAMYCSKHL